MDDIENKKLQLSPKEFIEAGTMLAHTEIWLTFRLPHSYCN